MFFFSIKHLKVEADDHGLTTKIWHIIHLTIWLQTFQLIICHFSCYCIPIPSTGSPVLVPLAEHRVHQDRGPRPAGLLLRPPYQSHLSQAHNQGMAMWLYPTHTVAVWERLYTFNNKDIHWLVFWSLMFCKNTMLQVSTFLGQLQWNECHLHAVPIDPGVTELCDIELCVTRLI